MNRAMIVNLLGMCVLGSALSAQVASPAQLTDDEVSNLIATVQNIPASRLDRKLSSITFADWLKKQSGADAKVGWAFRYDKAVGTPEWSGAPDCVEADAVMKDGHSIVVMVAVGHSERRVPYIFRIDLITGPRESTELNHLSDVPSFLSKLSPIKEAQDE
jgi:hypothetical protein